MAQQDLRDKTHIATPEEEHVFRRTVDGLELFVSLNLPRMPMQAAGRGTLFVSALMCVAGRLIANFPEDMRPIALENAQDYLARNMHAQAEQNRKDDEQRCPSNSPAKTSSN